MKGLAKTRLIPRGYRVTQLLMALGLPRKDLYAKPNRTCEQPKPTGAFWHRYDEYELRDILQKAHTAYRQRIAMAHPDRGGSTEEAAAINTCWKTIKRLFRQRQIEL